MPISVELDYETGSRIDLGETNSYKYSCHPSTHVICATFSVDGGSDELWWPGMEFPLAEHWPDVVIEAAGGEFEWNIWNNVCVSKYGWPELSPKQISCLQARAAYAGLPRKLETIAKNLGLPGKDMEGHRVMKQITKPNRGKLVGCEYFGGKFDRSPAKIARVGRYCLRDGRIEKAVSRLCPALPKREQILWRAHHRINKRGVPVDLAFARNAAALVSMEEKRLNAELLDISGIRSHGCLTKGNSGWLWMKSRGLPLQSLGALELDAALNGERGELDPLVKRALEIRKLCCNSSAGKFAAIVNHADADSRCRGAHVFYKAGPGRFAGAGVNFLNLRRLDEDETEKNLDWSDQLSALGSHPAELQAYHELLQKEKIGTIPTLSKLPRFAVCAGPGKVLTVCDYAAIEMRILHWMAGDERTLQEVRDFDAGKGEDVYKLAAGLIYNKPAKEISKAERKLGKEYRLGCGYLTGAAKFQNACKVKNIAIELDKAQAIVQLYRRSNPLIKKLWYALQDAVIAAVKGTPTEVSCLEYYMTDGALCCRLPSGRVMKYYAPALVDGEYGPELEAIDQRSGLRRAVSLPVIVENADQAIGRDLLGAAIIQLEQENLPLVLHVYDETVLELNEGDNESSTRQKQIMTSVPRWAKGLPIAASADLHRRYLK